MQRIIFRKGLDAQLPNIVLDVGSPGWVTDKRVLVVGDGSTNPPRIITTKSTGSFDFFNLDTLGMPGGLTFDTSKPGALGPITPARMVAGGLGLLAFRGLDSNGQDTWGSTTLASPDNTLTIANGNGSANNINLQINPDSEILKNLIRNTINVNTGNINGLNELINNLINAAISANDTVHYGVDTSTSANTIIVGSFDNPLTTLPAGTVLAITIANQNTGPTTANFGTTLGTAIPVVRMDGSPLKQNDLVKGTVYFGMRPDGKLAILNYNPTSLPLRNSLSFASSSTFTVPEGCYFIFVRVWGAGGGGGGTFGAPSAGAGAGAGGYSEGFFFVNPGQVLTVTVGAGGAQEQPGGTTSVGSLIYATGGAGGVGGNNLIQASPGSNGQGGNGGGGQLNIAGRTGGYGFKIGDIGCGGIGGSSPFGGSIPSLNVGTGGGDGAFPGGGANGGAQGNDSPGQGKGGKGAGGLVLLSF